MVSKIRLLDENTVNKIAAGEVVEGPNSVVKELVENSLDAEASDVIIEIKTGGRYLIRVSDDGVGMSGDDAILCLDRHATSKIRDINDVNSLATMGFRGEAIPSISSVSKFTLMTKSRDDSSEGTMVAVDGGRLVHQGAVVRDQGTTIEVKSLFFNVPVRKKFQKSVSVDVSNVHKVVIAQALAHPEVSFKLLSDNKTLMKCSAGELKKRISEVLGKDFIDNMRPLHYQEGGVVLEGFIGEPVYTRPNRTGQYIFVNKRCIWSGSISNWVGDGYGMRLATNRYPVFVLHITMPGDNVDINVHPQKREIRLRNGLLLRDVVVRGVDKALEVSLRRGFAESVAVPEPKISNFKPSFLWKGGVVRDDVKMVSKEEDVVPGLFEDKLRAPTVIATMKRYILAKGFKDDCIVIDQHAAHARVVFEQLQEKDLPILSQQLLVPYTFDVSSSETGLLEGYLEDINKLGIGIRSLGGNTFVVDAIPQILENCDVKTLIFEILEELQDTDVSHAISKKMEKKIAFAASRLAITTKSCLTLEQAQNLVDRLLKCKSPEHFPNGSPVMVSLGEDVLETIFKEERICHINKE